MTSIEAYRTLALLKPAHFMKRPKTIREIDKLLALPPEPGENMAIYHGNHAVWHADKAVIYANRGLYFAYASAGLAFLALAIRLFFR